jgi:hypothetical protein
MVAVKTGINENTDFGEVSSENEVREIVWNQGLFLKSNLSTDCRSLFEFLQRAESHGWPLYGTRDRYIEEGLGLPVQSVDWAAQGLEIVGRNKPVPFEKAKALGKPGNPTGTNQHTPEEDRKGSDYNGSSEDVGRGASYIEARLARDAQTDPQAADVMERYGRGELTAHAAAVEMGWRKRQDRTTKFRSLWRNATDEERSQIEQDINDWHKGRWK